MLIEDAQREVRTSYLGGFWGQMVSGGIWLTSAALGTWSTPRSAIITLVVAGFFIYPLTVLLLRASGRRPLSPGNSLYFLGMQVAFTLPLSMLLVAPVTAFRLNWFYPSLMVLLGAHYIPFTFLYGMRMWVPLSALLIGSGVGIALYWPFFFSTGAWVTAGLLFVFAVIGRMTVLAEERRA
ncbi:MAG TPA: hypothetical protein VGI16_05145 [Candidatus Acidoferrum sp.]|jgi:hypothetical protein